MKNLIYLVFPLLVAACGQKQEKVEIGSKGNFDKGSEIMAERNRQLKESNKILDEEIQGKKKQESGQSK